MLVHRIIMLRVIQWNRTQAFCGLVAGTIFSTACVDEDYHLASADAGSESSEELADWSQADLAPVTQSPPTQRPVTRPLSAPPQRHRSAVSKTAASEPAFSEPTASQPTASQPADDVHEAGRDIRWTHSAEVQELLTEGAEGVIVVELATPGSDEPLPKLQRKPMLQDSYTAFGAF